MILHGVRTWIPYDCNQWLYLTVLDTKNLCYSFWFKLKTIGTHFCCLGWSITVLFYFCHQDFFLPNDMNPPLFPFYFHLHSQSHTISPSFPTSWPTSRPIYWPTSVSTFYSKSWPTVYSRFIEFDTSCPLKFN